LAQGSSPDQGFQDGTVYTLGSLGLGLTS
jgi:hypothetical protein